MNKRLLALIILGIFGISLTTGANLTYLSATPSSHAVIAMFAYDGLALFILALVLINVGIFAGWFDNREAKA